MQQILMMGISILTASFHYLILRRFFVISKKRFARAVLFFVGYLMSLMIVFISDWGNLPPTFLIYIAGILYACDGSRLKRLTLSFMLASTVSAWNVITDNFIWVHSDSDSLLFLSRLVFMIALYLIIRFLGPDAKTELGGSLWHLMLFLSLTPIGIVFSVVLLSSDYGSNPEYDGLYLTLMFLTLFSFLGLLWAIAVLSRQRKLEQQNMYAEMNRKYYEAMQQQHFEIRRLKHDLANHLQALSLLSDKERKSYISNLLDSPAFVQRVDYCGDSTINAVLSVKEDKMKKLGVSFHPELDIPEELPFEKADICAVFANALDNAIEGCLLFPEEKRMIELSSGHQKGMFALSVKNPSDLILKPGSLPSTTKADSRSHGYGLQSIEEIVGRYQGHLEISAENGIFELFLYLPDFPRYSL